MQKAKDNHAKFFYFYLLPFALSTTVFLGATVLLPFEEVIPVAVGETLPSGVRRAYTLLEKGLVNDAIAAFEQSLRRYPRSLQAKLGLAIAYRRQGRIEQAWDTYQKVLAQDPNDQLALMTIGLLGGYRPEWHPRGIEALDTLLNLNPNNPEALAQRALLYSYQGRFAEALADYQIVLPTNPKPEVLLGAAQAYTNIGNWQQGLELFNRYRATGKPLAGYTAIAYARALREIGNPAAAVQVLETEVRASKKLDNQAILARTELTLAYLANQQSTEALAILDPLQGRADAILPLARSLAEIRRRTNVSGLTEQIATLYTQALAQNPTPDPKLVREAADVFSGLPEKQLSALRLYQQLTASQPNDQSLQVQQLALESQMGLVALPDLKARLSLALQNLPTDQNALQQLAIALVRLDPPGAEFLSAYQSLLQAGVDEPFLNFRIAQMLVQRNDLQGASSALAAYAATPAGAKDQAPQLLAAEIERRQGNLEAAQRRYQALIDSSPADQDILNAALRGLAGIRLTQNRAGDALAIYDQLLASNPQDLTIQLGRASLAHKLARISESEAEAVLSNWLQTQPATNAPAELFSIVGTLPPSQARESLYNALLEIDPNNIPVQLRLLQVIAARNPAAARARVAQLVKRDPNNVGAYFLQGQLAQGIGDLEHAAQAYQNILADQPDNTDALSALGGIRFQQRRFDSAEHLYSQVLELKPEDAGVRRFLASLTAVQDQPMSALKQMEQLQLEQAASGKSDSELAQERQKLQEGFLKRRGFQPPWERY